MKFSIYVRRVVNVQNVYALKVNIHRMMGQEKEMHSGEIQVLRASGRTEELWVRA